MLSSFFEDVKGWFKYSETILLARLQMFSGFVLAGLANVDWTALSNFTSFKQSMWLSVGLVANGLLTEYARRRGSNL